MTDNYDSVELRPNYSASEVHVLGTGETKSTRSPIELVGL